MAFRTSLEGNFTISKLRIEDILKVRPFWSVDLSGATWLATPANTITFSSGVYLRGSKPRTTENPRPLYSSLLISVSLVERVVGKGNVSAVRCPGANFKPSHPQVSQGRIFFTEW